MLQTFKYTGPVLGALSLGAHPVQAGVRELSDSSSYLKRRGLFQSNKEPGWANSQAHVYHPDVFRERADKLLDSGKRSGVQAPEYKAPEDDKNTTPEEAEELLKQAEHHVSQGLDLALEYTRSVEQVAVKKVPAKALRWRNGYRGHLRKMEPVWLQAIKDAASEYAEDHPRQPDLLEASQEALDEAKKELQEIHDFRMKQIHTRFAKADTQLDWPENLSKYYIAVKSRTIWLQARIRHCRNAQKELPTHPGKAPGSAYLADWRVKTFRKVKNRINTWTINFPRKDDVASEGQFDVNPREFRECDPRFGEDSRMYHLMDHCQE